MSILKCSHLFTDNMVLQRRKNIKIWGFAYDKTRVTVSINGITTDTVTVNNQWK